MSAAVVGQHPNSLRGGRAELPTPLHVGWRELHSNASLNFQLNRWLAYGGERWLADVLPVLPVLEQLRDDKSWTDTFMSLAERAIEGGRSFDAAWHLRAAEFFMLGNDVRKTLTRRRVTTMLRDAYGVTAANRRDVPYADGTLPTYCFPANNSRGTIVAFGGFDSYIEEFFPILLNLRDEGWTVVAFEGPGQGAALEEQHLSMTPHWHAAVGAVLDDFSLHDVTVLGISLGGCLAVRAAALEPRIARVVAFDTMTDFFACLLHQLPRVSGWILHALVQVRARKMVNRMAQTAARRRPVVQWGLQQAMHVFGCATPFDALRAAQAYRTDNISAQVVQHVLLLAGSEDHYVPLDQLREQERSLTAARSVTCRVFTREENGAAHCQVGNLPLAIHTINEWLTGVSQNPAPELGAAAGVRIPDKQRGKPRLPAHCSQVIIPQRSWRDLSSNTTSNRG